MLTRITLEDYRLSEIIHIVIGYMLIAFDESKTDDQRKIMLSILNNLDDTFRKIQRYEINKHVELAYQTSLFDHVGISENHPQ
jgi:hypothetical protein